MLLAFNHSKNAADTRRHSASLQACGHDRRDWEWRPSGALRCSVLHAQWPPKSSICGHPARQTRYSALGLSPILEARRQPIWRNPRRRMQRERPQTESSLNQDHRVWDHLRTTNPIESVFATVRHRPVRTKGALSQATAKLMVFKLIMTAAKTWRKLKGDKLLPKVIDGVTFKDGVEAIEQSTNVAA